MRTRTALVVALLCGGCGKSSASVEDRIDGLRARGIRFGHNEEPSAARMAELYPDREPGHFVRRQDDLRGDPDAAAILDAGSAAVPDLVRLLDDPQRRKLAAGFLAEIGGEPAANALLAQWRKHRGSIAKKDLLVTEPNAEGKPSTILVHRYEPGDGGYFAEVIYALGVAGRAVSAEVARDTSAAIDEAERLHAAGAGLDREEDREESDARLVVVTAIEPVETANEGVHILGMSGAADGPAVFARALRSPVERIRKGATNDVRYLGRGRDQMLSALGPLLDEPDPYYRQVAVSAVAFLTDRADVPLDPSPAKLESLATRYKALLRDQGHLPR